MTKNKLAAASGLTSRSITAFEAGDLEPSEKTLSQMAQVLGFPDSFFYADSLEAVSADAASFRSLRSMTASQRHAALGAGALAISLSEWIAARFNLPGPNVPDLRGYSPEAAAEAVRTEWSLGERPVKNMVHLLECQGVRVFSMAQECRSVDAFSLWRNGTPYIFLNTIKTAERSRFDAAHELAHLVLHRHAGSQSDLAEQEADSFASAFLMPKGSVLEAAPRLPSVDGLVKLKHNWKVSVAALAHRLRALQLLSDWHYRSLCIEISSRGFRKNEPESIQRETSQLLHKVFSTLRQERITKPMVAKELHIAPQELEALVFGLVLTQVDGGLTQRSAVPSRRDHLKVLESPSQKS
jgi:Zn-dependent peptidase ImmA (M78 family)